MSVRRECCDYCLWLGPVNKDGTMRKHRPATLDDKWGRPNQVQDMTAEPCRGSNKPFARFGCDPEATQPSTDQESTMTEYGVFEDSACIEAGFHGETGKAAAEEHTASLIAAHPEMADAYEVLEMCPDHEEQAKRDCEECATDGDEEEEEANAPQVAMSYHVRSLLSGPHVITYEVMTADGVPVSSGWTTRERAQERADQLNGNGGAQKRSDGEDAGPGFCMACGETFESHAALDAHQDETGHEMDQPDHPLRSSENEDDYTPSREAALHAARVALTEMPDSWRDDPAYWVGRLGQALEDVMHHIDNPAGTAEVAGER